MCPDREIISLYLDGELPSPWKEKLEIHLESCPACSGILNGYNISKRKVDNLSEESIQAAQERVWMKLEASLESKLQEPLIPSIPDYNIIKTRPDNFWNRTVKLPLPAAAAAAILILAAFFFGMGVRGNTPLPSQDAVAAMNIGYDDQGVVPITDMNGVLRYLSNQDNGDFMVIRLPESRNFSRIGDPTLINAADYSRSLGSR